ncbi:DUF1848 domain-containing protein [Lacrimispora aerotolerans]|uniref:DUF1848 domain-containing protein n=1 Tax=Lacrimispora aerotolerans TaxID=36832 RepID=UPI00047C2523|nr:DUF1848 domain-containing protein [Lacrimispora aerotolerans]
MILSVSRRTDIPRFYSDWFFERIKEGFLYVRNPMNSRQISRIDLSPEQVELIVFWTKDPSPMLGRLSELNSIPCYLQFTLTGYGRDVEPGLPDKQELIRVFKEFSKVLGPDRMVWRYDPIFINDRYEEAYHLRAFEQIAREFKGHTNKVVISFLDWYGKTARNMKGIKAEEMTEERMLNISRAMAEIAGSFDMRMEACAETADLSQAEVSRGSCIDPVMVEKILGVPIKQKKDKNQRAECGCLESVEVGAYDTCLMGCRYCYANDSQLSVERKTALYDVHSPLLCGRVEDGDKITERKAALIRKK